MAMGAFLSTQAQHSTVCLEVSTRFGKIIEGTLGRLNDVAGDEGCTFARALLAVFQATFPLEHRPTFEIVLREFRKDTAKIHLAIAERSEATGAGDPGLISAIDALASTRPKLSVLHVKHLDSVMVDVDEF